jgi:hypothetical protein
MRYTWPSLPALAFAAAPYRGKGECWFVKFRRLVDHGYGESGVPVLAPLLDVSMIPSETHKALHIHLNPTLLVVATSWPALGLARCSRLSMNLTSLCRHPAVALSCLWPRQACQCHLRWVFESRRVKKQCLVSLRAMHCRAGFSSTCRRGRTLCNYGLMYTNANARKSSAIRRVGRKCEVEEEGGRPRRECSVR